MTKWNGSEESGCDLFYHIPKMDSAPFGNCSIAPCSSVNEKRTVHQLGKIFPAFMELAGSLTCSKESQ
jgi:hypothetical protein